MPQKMSVQFLPSVRQFVRNIFTQHLRRVPKICTDASELELSISTKGNFDADTLIGWAFLLSPGVSHVTLWLRLRYLYWDTF